MGKDHMLLAATWNQRQDLRKNQNYLSERQGGPSMIKKQLLTLRNQDPKRHTLGTPERQTPARLNPDPLASTGTLRADLHTQGTLQLCACMNHSKPSGRWKNLTTISEENKMIVSHKEQGTK